MSKRSLTDYAAESVRIGKRKRGITISPVKGFFITLLFLGVPTVSLGTLCLSLIQNNLRLSEENNELQNMASEVKAEVDQLGEEIDTLRERAGVPEVEVRSQEADTISETSQNRSPSWLEGITRRNDDSSGIDPQAQSVAPASEEGFLPRGGPANAVSSLELLKDAQAKVPALNYTLDASVKPALEEILAEEAAYPDGKPVVGVIQVSSEFGIRSNPFGGGGYEVHEGMDFVGEQGDIIAATGDGIVTTAGSYGGYGLTVVIDHSYGYETLYAHMSEVKVNVGDTIKRGQIIGYIGSTGRSSGPHLHYGLYKDKEAIDPRALLTLSDATVASAE